MRYTLIVLWLAACVDRTVVVPDKDSVDGVYRLRLEYRENTCDRDWWPETWTNLYDVRLRFDGAYDFAPYREKDAGWPRTFSGVRIDHGVVNHLEEWHSGTTLHHFTNTLTGHIDQTFLDFTMTLNWENRDATPCYQRVRATGERWRVADLQVVEGQYLVMVSIFDNNDGYVCDGQLQQEVQLQRFQMTVSAPEDDEARIDFFNSGVRFRLPAVMAQVERTIVAHAWYSLIGWTDVDAKIVGDFLPDRVDLDLRIWNPWSDTDTCYYRYHIVGARILPGERLTGEFRAVTVTQDKCTGTGVDPITRDDKYVVIEQDDGWVQVVGRFGLMTWFHPAEDGSFSITLREGGGAATYVGSITPDNLRFFYTFKSDSETRDCGITRDVSAMARFNLE